MVEIVVSIDVYLFVRSFLRCGRGVGVVSRIPGKMMVVGVRQEDGFCAWDRDFY